MDNRVPEFIFRAIRQLFAVVMILFGSLLALNVAVGPCAGTVLAAEPFPAIFPCVAGLELILCSYFIVRKLKEESDFRVIIYLVLGLWSLTFLFEVLSLVRSGLPHSPTDLSDLYFDLLRGAAAVVNLIVFYKWAGTKNMITRIVESTRCAPSSVGFHHSADLHFCSGEATCCWPTRLVIALRAS